jgi:formylglycine-generating enzyme
MRFYTVIAPLLILSACGTAKSSDDANTQNDATDGEVSVESGSDSVADTGVADTHRADSAKTDSSAADSVSDSHETSTDSGPAQPKSCTGLTTQCQKESCCMSIVVPGGTFTQGSTDTTANAAQPPHSSTVSSFALDKYEVTVGRFRQFVAAYSSNTASAPAAGAGANPNIPGTGWDSTWNTNLPTTQAGFISALKCDSTYQTWTDTAGSNEAKAINCVDWFEAQAFCAWDGGRLPTESEWEYAAAGGSEDRVYPWGSTAPDCTYANFYTGSAYCSSPTGVMSVGSFAAGAGKWGHQDLAGNVWEWNFDWYALYTSASSNNYANITTSSDRVVRGGYFDYDATYLLAAYRDFYDPTDRYVEFGLRCSRTP